MCYYCECTCKSYQNPLKTASLEFSCPLAVWLLIEFICIWLLQGAATQCYVALHPQVKGISGEYFADSNKAKASALSQDAELARKLWDFSFSMTNQD